VGVGGGGGGGDIVRYIVFVMVMKYNDHPVAYRWWHREGIEL
jgi:hypothetical protein